MRPFTRLASQILTTAGLLLAVTTQPGIAQDETPAPSDVPPAMEAAAASVEISGFAFNPASITVPVGATVTWTNRDTTSHTATGTGFDTGPLTNGQTGSATFSTPGRVEYGCSIHTGMRAVVDVQ